MSSTGSDPLDVGRPRALVSIVGGGLLAGILDILDAIIVWRLRTGASAARIFQSVASGLLGRSAFQGGLPTAALGAFLHFFIATSAASIYFLAGLRLKILVRRPVLSGLVYGVAVFFFMRDVILPLSAIGPSQGPFSWLLFLNGILIHAFGVGLPIALFARRSAAAPDPDRVQRAA